MTFHWLAFNVWMISWFLVGWSNPMTSRLCGIKGLQGGLPVLSSRVYMVVWIMMCPCRARKWGLKPASLWFGFAGVSLED